MASFKIDNDEFKFSNSHPIRSYWIRNSASSIQNFELRYCFFSFNFLLPFCLVFEFNSRAYLYLSHLLSLICHFSWFLVANNVFLLFFSPLWAVNLLLKHDWHSSYLSCWTCLNCTFLTSLFYHFTQGNTLPHKLGY